MRMTWTVFAAASAVCMSVGAAVDLTAVLRETGPENYVVSVGDGTDGHATKEVSSYSVANAFDGDASADQTKRVIIQTYADKPTPVSVIYSVSASAVTNSSLRLSSFVLNGVNAGQADSWNVRRNPTAFSLEGWDGTEWHTLFATNGQTWTSLGEVKEYGIPEECRGDYRKFKFNITAVGEGEGWAASFQEIRFLGDMVPRPLTWTGAANGNWDATSAN